MRATSGKKAAKAVMVQLSPMASSESTKHVAAPQQAEEVSTGTATQCTTFIVILCASCRSKARLQGPTVPPWCVLFYQYLPIHSHPETPGTPLIIYLCIDYATSATWTFAARPCKSGKPRWDIPTAGEHTLRYDFAPLSSASECFCIRT
jgi:hypothetical protein